MHGPYNIKSETAISSVFVRSSQNATAHTIHGKPYRHFRTRYKASVCGHSLAGIAGSNPADDMDVCLLMSVVCCQEGLCKGPIPRSEGSY
jgi:hypothetical protein